jgi:hypothetical protein
MGKKEDSMQYIIAFNRIFPIRNWDAGNYRLTKYDTEIEAIEALLINLESVINRLTERRKLLKENTDQNPISSVPKPMAHPETQNSEKVEKAG